MGMVVMVVPITKRASATRPAIKRRHWQLEIDSLICALRARSEGLVPVNRRYVLRRVPILATVLQDQVSAPVPYDRLVDQILAL